MKELIRKVRSWVRTDGLMHIETSAILLMIVHILFPLWFSVVSVAFMGIAKEYVDMVSNKGCAEMHDIYCDCIGIVLGIILVLL